MDRDLQEVVDLLEDDAWQVTEHEALLVLQEIFNIPIELLEARLALIRGEELLTTEGL